MFQVQGYDEVALDCRLGCCVSKLRMNRSGRGLFIHQMTRETTAFCTSLGFVCPFQRGQARFVHCIVMVD